MASDDSAKSVHSVPKPPQLCVHGLPNGGKCSTGAAGAAAGNLYRLMVIGDK